ncbi:MAG TPA: response regulator [Chthoniobacterales bacterium]
MLKPSAKDGMRGLRILLVDDHPDSLRSIGTWMRRRGYTVIPASSAQHALKAAEQEPFDVLVSDLGLPDGDGWQLLVKLSQRRMFTAIAISGFSAERDLERSRAAGFVRHLVKPFDPRVLHGLLEDIRRQLEDGSAARFRDGSQGG